jgi:DNA repair exonuclease SbcCD ATPase subunit
MLRLLSYSAENFKKITLARFKPTGALTRIIGKNAAGKTSILDGIAAAIGGKALCPEMPIKRGERTAEVTLDLDQYIVTRKFWLKDDESLGSSVSVTGREGAVFSSPQTKILDGLVGDLSFDPLHFQGLKPREQAGIFARLAGIDLDDHEATRKGMFERRAALSKEAKAQDIRAKGLPLHKDAPAEPQSAADLMAKLKERQEHNVGVQAINDRLGEIEKGLKNADETIAARDATIKMLTERLAQANKERAEWITHKQDLLGLQVAAVEESKAAAIQDTREIETAIAATDSVNAKVRENQRRAEAITAAAKVQATADELSRKLEEHDLEFQGRIAAAQLPVPGLTFDASGVKLDGIPFEQCSGAQRLRTSVAVGLALNPKLKLMLIKDGSLLDSDGMALLAELAEAADAQILVERVDNGHESGVLIVDGETVEGGVSDGQ